MTEDAAIAPGKFFHLCLHVQLPGICIYLYLHAVMCSLNYFLLSIGRCKVTKSITNMHGLQQIYF